MAVTWLCACQYAAYLKDKAKAMLPQCRTWRAAEMWHSLIFCGLQRMRAHTVALVTIAGSNTVMDTFRFARQTVTS